MKAIIFALVLIMVSCDEDPRPHIAQFTHQQAIAQFSGMDQIFTELKDMNLDPVEWELIPNTLVEVRINSVKTHGVVLKLGDVKCNIEIHKPVAHCVGANMVASMKFEYELRSDMLLHIGKGNCLMNFHDSYLDIEFTKDINGHPSYVPSVQLAYTISDLNVTSDTHEAWHNDAVKILLEKQVQADFTWRALDILNDRANKYFHNLSLGYKDTYKYYPPGSSHAAIDIDMTVLKVNSSMLGIVYEIDGSIAGIEPGPTELTEVPYNLGKKQMVFTKYFALEFVAFANNFKYFVWTFEPNGILNMPSFDFLVADLWVIFPDSRSDSANWTARDPLKVYCFGDRNEDPNVKFLNATQRVEFVHRFGCGVSHTLSGNTILNFTFIANFEVEFALRENTTDAVVTVYSVTTQPTSIVNCKYPYARRQLGIIDSLIKEALITYTTDREVLGTGYKILPMQQIEYEIYDKQLIIFGEPVKQPPPVTNSDTDASFML